MREEPSRAHLLWLQVSQSFASQLASSVFYPFLKQHFSFAELSVQSVIQYSVPLLLLPFIRVFWLKRCIIFALVINALRLAFLPAVDTRLEAYLAAAVAGLMLVFFWVPYEIMYFRRKDAHGRSSAWYFNTFSVVGIATPLLAGLIADRFGYPVLFWLGSSLVIVPLFFTFRLPDRHVNEGLFSSLRFLRGIRHLIFFDGFLLSASMCLIGLSLLTFTDSAFEFGAIGSVAMLFAALVSFPAAFLSDARKDRFLPIALMSVASAVSLIALGWQSSLWWFSLIFIVYTSIRVLTQPIVNALPMDLCLDHTKLYVARQFLLNAGRVLGFGLTWVSVLTVGLKPMYLLYALAYLIYLFCVRRVLRGQAA